jgi:SAM-dependent methyltransferase
MMIEGLGWTVPYTVMKCATQAGLPGKPLNILDVGCHEAGFLDALTLAREKKPDLFPAEVAAYTGLDFSASAIKQAKQKHPQHTFIHGDAVDLQTYESIPDRSQDLIICSGLCDYLLPPQINILLENLERKLAPGGKIVLTYRTTLAKYGVPEPQAVEIDSPFILKFEIEGIKFLMFPDNIFTLYYVCYPPDEFEKIIAASNLRLDLISSQSRPANNDGPPNIYDFVVLESVS